MVSIVELLGNNDFPQKPILETLICHRTGLSKTDLFSKLDNQLSLEDIQRIVDGYHAYTIEKKPLEYILGRVEFSGLRFQVTPETIIPRPETEYMIEAIREFLKQNKGTPHEREGKVGGVTLFDIGTGSGILGLSTLYHCGQYISQAYLTDLSSEALEVAKKNTQQLLSPVNCPLSTVNFLECSLLDHPTIHELLCHSDKEVILVANLPYIPDELYASNAPESLTKWEPKMAFVGGEDGLDLYRQMFDQILVYQKKTPLPPLPERGEWYELFEKEQLQKRGLTRAGGHQPYNKDLKERARIMRKNMTVAEKYLRKTYLQHCGKTVQRQKIIDHFIVDFYIAQHRLAIEVDGRTHDTADAKEYDNYRTKILEQYNVRIIRFSNEQVLYNLDQVVQQLKAVYSLPPLGKGGEGGFFTPSSKRGTGDDVSSPYEEGEQAGIASSLPKKGSSNITLFLEMMTRQGKLLAEEYQGHFVFEEIKTFHGNIRILKGTTI